VSILYSIIDDLIKLYYSVGAWSNGISIEKSRRKKTRRTKKVKYYI
jgi:hypothetical protein